MLIVLGITLVGALLFIYLFSIINKDRETDLEELELEEEELEDSINAKTIQLTELNQGIEKQSINKDVSLSNIKVKILDIYEESHIQIPVDIVEELSNINLYEEKEIFDYIENQRNYWKLENQKKPFRKVK